MAFESAAKAQDGTSSPKVAEQTPTTPVGASPAPTVAGLLLGAQRSLGNALTAALARQLASTLARESIESQVPSGLAFQDLHAQVSLPASVVLKSDTWADLQTSAQGAQATLTLNSTELILTFSGVFLEGLIVARCNLQKAQIDLRTGQILVWAETDTSTFGFDPRKKLESGVHDWLKEVLAGSPIGTDVSYDASKDPDPKGTLEKVVDAIQKNTAGGGSSPLNKENVNVSEIGLDLKTTEDIVKGEGPATVVIPAGTTISLNSFPDVKAADFSLSKLKSVTLSSSITVQNEGAPAASIKSIEVAGGQVKITDIELLGDVKKKAETEQGFWGLLGLTASLLSGLPPELAWRKMVLDNPHAVIVPGITRDMIEKALQKALSEWVAVHGSTLGGVDLSGILGGSGAPAPSP